MPDLDIRPGWTLVNDRGERVNPHLFTLLQAIHEGGKLTAAARQAGVSYRHAWDLLGEATAFFGSPLVELARGRGARLTPLGQQIVWAGQRAEARLGPQLDNAASELRMAIQRVRAPARPLLRLHASHCYALERLAPLARGLGRFELDLQYMGSAAALESLARGQCEVAGFHVPVGPLAREVHRDLAPWLQAADLRVLRLVTRSQGLIVPRGNPRGLATLADLGQRGLRFIGRQRGSGTRLLFEALIRQAGVDRGAIAGVDDTEFTHAAVAAFVGSGMADAGFGIEAAARQFRLDFVPLVQERYALACQAEALRSAPLRHLRATLAGAEFAAAVADLAGYALDQPGELVRPGALAG